MCLLCLYMWPACHCPPSSVLQGAYSLRSLAALGPLRHSLRCTSLHMLSRACAALAPCRAFPQNSLYCFDNWGAQLVDFISEQVQAPAYIICNSVGGEGCEGLLQPGAWCLPQLDACCTWHFVCMLSCGVMWVWCECTCWHALHRQRARSKAICVSAASTWQVAGVRADCTCHHLLLHRQQQQQRHRLPGAYMPPHHGTTCSLTHPFLRHHHVQA